jgi:hypothetical protein
MDSGLYILLGAFPVCGLVGYFWWRTRSPKVEFLSMRCPRCSQKVRYHPNRAGHSGMCPQCGRRWTLLRADQIPPVDYAQPGYRIGRK